MQPFNNGMLGRTAAWAGNPRQKVMGTQGTQGRTWVGEHVQAIHILRGRFLPATHDRQRARVVQVALLRRQQQRRPSSCFTCIAVRVWQLPCTCCCQCFCQALHSMDIFNMQQLARTGIACVDIGGGSMRCKEYCMMGCQADYTAATHTTITCIYMDGQPSAQGCT